MKSAFKYFQIFLLLCGVFGADQDEVASVMEGDFVTLNPDLTQIKKFYLIEWRFGDPVIAQTDGNDISYPSHTEIFRNRLQLSQTGSLTVMNMKIKHSGLYKLKISHSTGTSLKKFNVTVYVSASDAGKAEIKSMSLTEGNSVTLQTDVPQLNRDELIVWRFGDKGELIAKVDIEAKSSPLYYDKGFRDRLQLDHQTGSLTITNTRTTDSGLYTVKISSNKQTLYKNYAVTILAVPGLSSGQVTGIVTVVVVLLLLLAAVAVVVIYRKNPLVLTLEVMDGDDVILQLRPITMREKIILCPINDQTLSLVGPQNTCIFAINKKTYKEFSNDDELFRGRLDVDETGSLTIANTTIRDSGIYQVNNKNIVYKKFILTVKERFQAVNENGEVTLQTCITVANDAHILWRFNHYPIIERSSGKDYEYDSLNHRFKTHLILDNKSGSLTIKNASTKHTGVYELKINHDGGKSRYMRFNVIGNAEPVSVNVGDTLILKTDGEIQRDNTVEVHWIFGTDGQIIAKKTPYTNYLEETLASRLGLDQAGCIEIKDIKKSDSGHYILKIIDGSKVSNTHFQVTVEGNLDTKTLAENETLYLLTNNDIKMNEQVQWIFNSKTIVTGMNGDPRMTSYDDAAGDRLQLDHRNGSLIIENTKTSDTGDYYMHISNSKREIRKKFRVTVSEKQVNESATVVMPLINE